MIASNAARMVRPEIQDVVDQDGGAVAHPAVRFDGLAERSHAPQPQIVSVQRHVQRPDRDRDVGEHLDAVGEPVRQRDAAGGDAEENRVEVDLGDVLDDLMRDPVDDPGDISIGENATGVVARRIGATFAVAAHTGRT